MVKRLRLDKWELTSDCLPSHSNTVSGPTGLLPPYTGVTESSACPLSHSAHLKELTSSTFLQMNTCRRTERVTSSAYVQRAIPATWRKKKKKQGKSKKKHTKPHNINTEISPVPIHMLVFYSPIIIQSLKSRICYLFCTSVSFFKTWQSIPCERFLDLIKYSSKM